MQMNVANDEVPQKPGRRIKLFGMRSAVEEEVERSGGGGEGEEGRGASRGTAPSLARQIRTECCGFTLSSNLNGHFDHRRALVLMLVNQNRVNRIIRSWHLMTAAPNFKPC